MIRTFKLCSPAALAYEPGLEPECVPEGPECEECGGEMAVTTHGRATGYWWTKATCPDCGHSFEHDNYHQENY